MLDAVDGSVLPLYDSGHRALMAPLGLPNGAAMRSADTPSTTVLQGFPTPIMGIDQTADKQVGYVKYTHAGGITMNDSFQVWLVAYHVGPGTMLSPNAPFSALLVRDWQLVFDSTNNVAKGAPPTATFPNPAVVPTAAPVTAPPPANFYLENSNAYQTKGQDPVPVPTPAVIVDVPIGGFR